jgi:imidazolonepropionase-like amidohydrolase
MAYGKGVKMLYGSDLLGTMQRHQLQEFSIRSKVVSNIDLIRQATVNAAECFGRVGDIGEILEGGLANIIAYRNDPLKDIQVLVSPEDNLSLIINRGVTVKDQV